MPSTTTSPITVSPHPPHPPPPLSPASPQLLERVRSRRESIHAAVLADFFARYPPATDTERARLAERCRADLGSHLDQLLVALEVGDAEIFGAYLRWLHEVLTSHRSPVAYTSESLGVIRRLLAADTPDADLYAVLALLDHGIATFDAAPAGPGVPMLAPPPPVHAMTESLLAGQREQAEAQIEAAMREGAALVDVSVDLLQPAMYQVGSLWQQNRISVAQEHLATAIAQSAMAMGFSAADMAPPNGRTAAFACVEGNAHTLGLRMVSDAFELDGWDVRFLGANVPSRDLVAFCDQDRPDLLGLSVSLPPQLPTLRALIGELRAELGNAAPRIVVGGLLVNQLGAAARSVGADAWFRDAREAASAASG